MAKNMGSYDRIVRLLIALALALLYFTGMVGGALGIIFLVVAVVFLITSLVGYCPGYAPMGVSTCGKSKGSSQQA